MEPVFLKYRSHDHDYLIFDTLKNRSFLDSHAVRAICYYNCGLGSLGIVAGPYESSDGKMAVKFYTPEGQETLQDRMQGTVLGHDSYEKAGAAAESAGMSSDIVEEGLRAGFSYLLDAGYLSGADRGKYDARPVGKVFLSEKTASKIFSA